MDGSVFLFLVTFFARAGGGGSDSGGVELMALPGLAAAGVAGLVRKKTGSKLAGIATGVAAGTAVSALYLLGGLFWFLFALISVIIGAPAGAFADKLSRWRGNSQAAKLVAQKAAAGDGMWDQQQIIQHATTVFHRFQYDWQRMDLMSIKQYTTTEYAKHVGLMLYAMQQMGRVNRMGQVTISEALLTGAHDDVDDGRDSVSIGFVAQAKDELIDAASGKVLRTDTAEFGEQWHFRRSGQTWLLSGIDQSTEDPSQLMQPLQQFAHHYGMYYSPDWGNLLLPTRGQLFKRGFGGADINNHIIGFWTGDLLVQLYTYRTIDSGSPRDHYIVGQVVLPKSYGGILVERRDGLFKGRLRAPSGYKKVTLEWGDFHTKYHVYATQENMVTSFELLNPAFMAWLYDRDIKVNIEVVDTVVYLYAKIKAGEQRYEDMMTILQRAYKELKM